MKTKARVLIAATTWFADVVKAMWGAGFNLRYNNPRSLQVPFSKHVFTQWEDEPGRRSVAKLLSQDKARGIAANIAKLPELLSKAWTKTRNPKIRGGQFANRHPCQTAQTMPLMLRIQFSFRREKLFSKKYEPNANGQPEPNGVGILVPMTSA
jgi:hypothetical protein